MDKKLFSEKIQKLSDDDLVRLLQMRNEGNCEIMALVESEALIRTLTLIPLNRHKRKNALDHKIQMKSVGLRFLQHQSTISTTLPSSKPISHLQSATEWFNYCFF